LVAKYSQYIQNLKAAVLDKDLKDPINIPLIIAAGSAATTVGLSIKNKLQRESEDDSG